MNTNENVIYAQINGFGGTYTEKFALFCENPNGRVFLYAFNVETKTSSIYCFDPGCEHKPTERDLVTGEPLSTPCMAEELGGTMSVILRGQRIPLKAKEFALLKTLYDHKNTIVTKEKLFDEVWGDSYYGDGTLNVHIRKLREKLEADPNDPEFIRTVWGTGYILELK